MTCKRCKKTLDVDVVRCPYCGQTNLGGSGVFQVSTVLISTGGEDLMYRSVEEVPAGLRTRLVQSTNSANSATILIADRRGRQEIARAMRNLPGPDRRRLIHSLLTNSQSRTLDWLTPARKRVILAAIALGALAVVAAALTYR